jgi:hypothetical protein
MRVTCPHCQKAFDLANREVLAQAARIMGGQGGKGCSDAKRDACRANARKPRPGRQNGKPRKPPVESA